MHYHYFTLLHLRDALSQAFTGQRLLNCFSQNRNELVVELEDGYFRIGCHTPLTFFFTNKQYAKARRNVVDLFPQVKGSQVTGFRVTPYERELTIELAGDQEMVCKLHGISANVLLRQQGKVVQLFNQQLTADLAYSAEPGPYDSAPLAETVAPSKRAVKDALHRMSPVFEKRFAERILYHMTEGELTFGEAFGRVMEEVEDEVFYLVKEEGRVRFWLFPPVDAAAEGVPVRGILPALQAFIRAYYQFDRYQRQHRELDKELGKPVQKLEKVLNHYQQHVTQLEQDRSPEEIGHLLMANLHIIAPQAEQVVLQDFYSGEDVTIKLDSRLSPQENAARYYEKHKDRRTQLLHLREQLEEVAEKLAHAREQAGTFSQLTPPDALRLKEEGFDSDALKALRDFAKARQQVTEAQGKQYPFRHYRYEGYDIFAGKNARNSDELSFKFASKNDLWLHVKDVPGSHVIVRQKAGQDLPPAVLEYAASLAAFFSKRKSDSLVPVQYTPRKYIRKRKGDPPGLVVVDREEVIMVEPWRE
jgi:predicted ribosome quality control (RQC) complex YloA/Tae2 family protein